MPDKIGSKLAAIHIICVFLVSYDNLGVFNLISLIIQLLQGKMMFSVSDTGILGERKSKRSQQVSKL